jgi:hypothetical protein
VALNSPSGLPNANYMSTTSIQLQWLNAVYSQAISYAAAEGGVSVTVTIDACTTPGTACSDARVFLAAQCFSLYQTASPAQTVGKGYWIFTNDLLLGRDKTSQQYNGWTLYGTQFNLQNLPPDAYAKYGPATTNNPNGLGASFLTEFEWSQRPDGTLLALVTPAGFNLTSTLQPVGTPLPFPCLALDLNLTQSCSLGSPGCGLVEVEATIGDSYPQNSYQSPGENIFEYFGPNGCAYDPNSNTGVLIVRHLLDTIPQEGLPAAPFLQYQAWWIMDSGVLP